MTDSIGLADRVVAAADLDDDARQTVDIDVDSGADEWAVVDAVLRTRTPLPTDLLKQVQAAFKNFHDDYTRQLVLDALDRQQPRDDALR